jgi:hypothetical protein
MPQGRHSEYDPTIALEICSRIAAGESLRKICLDEQMPVQSTVFKWITANEDFAKQYACARTAQMEAMAEEIIEIADDGLNDTYETEDGERTNSDVIQRSRLRVDTRKWLMSKLAPKKYGDKVEQFISGPDGGPIKAEVKIEFVKTKNINS